MNRKEASRRVLIFGGAGFIGSNLAGRLLQTTDSTVHIFDNLSREGVRHNLGWLQSVAGNSGRLQITIGDVRNVADVESAVCTASEIYHLAAQVAVTSSLADPRQDFEVNLLGTFNILDAIRKGKHRPFLLFTSTNKVYGGCDAQSQRKDSRNAAGIAETQQLDFHSPYGCSKGAADQYVRDFARVYNIPAVVFRMSCVAGPHQFGTEDQGWVAHFLFSALLRRRVVIYGDGRQVRDVLFVGDLLRAFEAVWRLQSTTQGQIYNVGGGVANGVSLLDLAGEIESLTGRRLDYVFAPRRQGDQSVYVTDFSKLQRDTGWAPQVPVRELLHRMRGWWEANRELFSPPRLPATAAEANRLEEVGQAA